jgi:hypothetical protein
MLPAGRGGRAPPPLAPPHEETGKGPSEGAPPLFASKSSRARVHPLSLRERVRVREVGSPALVADVQARKGTSPHPAAAGLSRGERRLTRLLPASSGRVGDLRKAHRHHDGVLRGRGASGEVGVTRVVGDDRPHPGNLKEYLAASSDYPGAGFRRARFARMSRIL